MGGLSALDCQRYLYEAGKKDEDVLRLGELEQHSTQGKALAEVKNYEKQVFSTTGQYCRADAFAASTPTVIDKL